MAADPRPRRNWTARDDQAAIFIFMVTPFLEIKSVLHLLPDRTPAEIHLRFLKIMDNPVLQRRLIDEMHSDIILRHSVAWQPHELLALAAVAAESNRASDGFQDNPQLFHPTRTLSSLAKRAARIGAGDRAAVDRQIRKYYEWADEIARRVADLDLLDVPDEDDSDSPDESDGTVPPLPPTTSSSGSDHPDDTDEESDDTIGAPELRRQRQARAEKKPPPHLKKRAETSLAVFRGVVERQFQKSHFAAFVGRLGIEVMGQSRVTFGRASPKTKPDIDLSGYHVQAIARIHCAVALKADLQFYAEVIGPDLIIDGDLFFRGTFVRLHDGSVIDFAGIPLMFFENGDIMNGLRQSV
jgi:hypothetical protein